jgi:hypothetical protein
MSLMGWLPTTGCRYRSRLMQPEHVAAVLAAIPEANTVKATHIQHATGLTHEQTYSVLAHLEAVGSVRVAVMHQKAQVNGCEWERM